MSYASGFLAMTRLNNKCPHGALIPVWAPVPSMGIERVVYVIGRETNQFEEILFSDDRGLILALLYYGDCSPLRCASGTMSYAFGFLAMTKLNK
jgi:hypothetical protein